MPDDAARMLRAIVSFIGIGGAAVLLCRGEIAGAEQGHSTSAGRNLAQRAAANETDIQRLREEVIEKMKEARERVLKLLALRELELQRLESEYKKRLEYYRQGLISRDDTLQAEHALAKAKAQAEQDRRWLIETDAAITEATMSNERTRGRGAGGFGENPTLARFNGDYPWTLADAPTIEQFFLLTFGRNLPVSAWGQTPTHDRLKFDHRDAIDVALHPESTEGRELLRYLRHAGIPHVAFNEAFPGASTGAHIHIGRPSRRGWSTVNALDGKSTARD